MSKELKRLIAFGVGILLAIILLVVFKLYMNQEVFEHKAEVRNYRSYERYWSTEIYKQIIDNNTLPIFGSSELTSLEDYHDTVSNFLNGDQMNVVTIGAGLFQSLSHTITLGAISDSIPRKKIALFLSPQWFGEGGIEGEAFASKMSENELIDFLTNPNISKKNKQYVMQRVITLLESSPVQLKRVEKYIKAVQSPALVEKLYMKIMNLYWDFRGEYEVYKQLDDMPQEDTLPNYDLSNLDWKGILMLAEEQGRMHCTNNDFGVNDQYWEGAYVQGIFQKGEVEEKNQYYTSSVEYSDFECFLSVATELGMEVYVVNIPVNGKWCNYGGILCDDYYENIRQIVGEYENAVLIDMSKYENEKYFFKDIMHLGWKGWARINEELYKEFTSE